MEEADRKLLEQDAAYSGEGISVRALEDTIRTERGRQNGRLDDLAKMRVRNAELQSALAQEMKRLKELSEQLGQESPRKGALRRLLGWFGGRGQKVEHRSVEELLRGQYEASAMRLKEAAEFVDRLEAAKQDLYDEVERLNGKIVESAANEETAADLVKKLQAVAAELQARADALDPGSHEARRVQADLDRARRRLAEHAARLQLYSTAEERLAVLKQNTWRLAEIIGHLQADISRYVTLAGEKLDLIGGQIQAIGAAADASLVLLELKQSLEAMTESIHHTTRFVAETQAYFRDNVDRMVEDLNVYDSETERVLAETAATSDAFGEVDVEAALSAAIARKMAAARASVPTPPGSG